METKDCKRCKNRFRLDALVNGLCGVCVDLPPQPEEDEGRIVSSKTVRETDVVTIVRDMVKETVPTREQIEVMIKLIVKEEMAAVANQPPLMVISNDGIHSVPSPESKETTSSGRTMIFKPKNCIKCGQQFTPFVGFQKICDNCKTKAKETQ